MSGAAPAAPWVYSALMITTIILSLILLVVIVARENLRKRVFNQLVVSMALGSLIFNVFAKPGTIYNDYETKEMDAGYCKLYQLLLSIEWYFMPFMFWMMSIERLIALRAPEEYFKKMTNGARAALVAVPWCYAVFFAVITIFILGDKISTRYDPYTDDPDYKDNAHLVRTHCWMEYTESDEFVANNVMLVFGTIIPVLALAASGLALLIIFYRRRNIKVYDSDGVQFILTGSIVLCHLLNMLAVLMLLVKTGLANIAGNSFLYHHYWSIVELVAVILAICVLPDVRQVICCCCKQPAEESRSLLGGSKETPKSNKEKQPEN